MCNIPFFRMALTRIAKMSFKPRIYVPNILQKNKNNKL